jgi:hypothetical protein
VRSERPSGRGDKSGTLADLSGLYVAHYHHRNQLNFEIST